MPNWKKLIVSGSDASLNSLSVTTNVTAQSFTGSLFGTSSFANTASFVTTLNQTVIITGSLGVGVTSLGSTENTLVLGPAPAGGSGEGGQILLQAQGGSYTSASMLDNYQNKFRLLRGTNAGSDGYKLQVDLQTGQLQLPNYNSTSAFTGTTLVGFLGFDSSGNILTAQTSSTALSGGSTNYVARWASSIALTTGSIYDTGTNVGIGITSPSSKLHVTDTSNPTINIGTLNGNTGNAGIQFYSGTGGSNNGFLLQYIKNGSTDRFGFIDGGSVERLTVLNGGNVGIGTTSPGAKLHVASGEIRVDAGQAVTLDTGNVMYLVGASSQLRLYNGGNPIVNITTGGNVGIGTTSPSQVLEVQGQAQIGNDNVTSAGLFIARKNTNQAKSHYFLSAQESPTYQWIEGGYFTSELAGVSVANNSGKPYYEAYSPAGQNKSFGFINQTTSGSSFTSTAATASMVLYQGGNIALAPTQGNVGIGTYSPTAKLEVTGEGSGSVKMGSTGFGGDWVGISLSGTLNTSNYNLLSSATNASFYLNRPTGGDMLFRHGNSDQMIIKSGGNVGIGTTSPSTKLDVIGNSYISGSLSVKTTSTAGTGLTVGGSTVLLSFAEIQQGNALYLYSSGNTYYSTIRQVSQNLILTPDTNVGIGTTSPSYKLDIVGATNTAGLYSRGANIGFESQIAALGTNGAYQAGYYLGATNTVYAARLGMDVNSGDVYLGIGNTGSLSTVTYFKANGNVGIGTTSPSTKLHVVGTSLFTDVLTFAGDTRYGVSKVYNSSTGDMFGMEQVSAAQTGTGAATRIFADDASNNYISLGSYTDATTFVDRLKVLTNNGNVGIGTSSPSQKLDVAGAISVSGSVIDYEVSPGLIGPGPAVNIISFTPGTHYAAFVDYVIKDASTGANQRVGTIQVSISLAAAAAVLNEVTTVDIGNTSAITFAVAYGAPTWLTATNSGITPYDINYMVRYF